MTIIYAAATPVLYHFVDMGGYRIVPSVAISIDNYNHFLLLLLLLSPHSPSSSSQETATTYSVHGNGLNKSYGRSFFLEGVQLACVAITGYHLSSIVAVGEWAYSVPLCSRAPDRGLWVNRKYQVRSPVQWQSSN